MLELTQFKFTFFCIKRLQQAFSDWLRTVSIRHIRKTTWGNNSLKYNTISTCSSIKVLWRKCLGKMTLRCFLYNMYPLHINFFMHCSVSYMTRGRGVHRWVEPVQAAMQHTQLKSSTHHKADIHGKQLSTLTFTLRSTCTSSECMSLDCERNPGNLEGAHTDMARTYILQPRTTALFRAILVE